MKRPFLERDPCPDRILDDVGAAFGIGAIGGSAYFFTKGLFNSPRGARIAGGMEALCMNVPRVGGGFAVWGGLFSACDCALVYARQKEDPYNTILAAAATCGALSLRQGFRSIATNSLMGAGFCALVCGAKLMMSRPPKTSSLPAEGLSDQFGRKVEEEAVNRSCKTETSETYYDELIIPMSSYEYK